jgi:hypothetical protein
MGRFATGGCADGRGWLGSQPDSGALPSAALRETPIAESCEFLRLLPPSTLRAFSLDAVSKRSGTVPIFPGTIAAMVVARKNGTVPLSEMVLNCF